MPGRSEHRELENRLLILLVHLLKWQYQPRRQTHSWCVTIREQRCRLERLLTRNPSLRPILDTASRRFISVPAMAQTGLREDTFATDCPWPPAQVLDVKP
jgi:Domain of unknown function DUF29